VEEALSNAIYHRSYQIHEPVTVTVTPETMDILSIPGPDISISDEDLANRVLISSRYRNRRIGDFLKELKLVEGRNTGIPLIINAMRQNGSALPEFKTDESRSYFRVILPIHPVFLREEEPVEQPVRTERRRSSRRTKTELKQLITVALRQDDLSMRELSAQLGYAKLTDSVRLIVKEMIEKGEAEYLYPDKANNPNQKIRLK
jgi:ATP-dependent DNA helicase RecG